MNAGRNKPPRSRVGARSTASMPGNVRIIGGRWRGTRLPVPQHAGLRPTSDRVRETLFNWLQPRLPGARVLDLFAGSGALGLEALSRGAASLQLVEAVPQIAAGLQATVDRLQAADVATVHCGDAVAWLRKARGTAFDVAFVDPPFDAALWPAVLGLLPAHLSADAWIHVESPATQSPEVPADWVLHRESRTRDVRFVLYRRG